MLNCTELILSPSITKQRLSPLGCKAHLWEIDPGLCREIMADQQDTDLLNNLADRLITHITTYGGAVFPVMGSSMFQYILYTRLQDGHKAQLCFVNRKMEPIGNFGIPFTL
jgi:hypothetical protein